MSPWITSTSSKGMPSSDSTICDHEVACPWPCGEVPVITVTLPVGCTRTVEVSQPPGVSPMAWVTAEGARPQIST